MRKIGKLTAFLVVSLCFLASFAFLTKTVHAADNSSATQTTAAMPTTNPPTGDAVGNNEQGTADSKTTSTPAQATQQEPYAAPAPAPSQVNNSTTQGRDISDHIIDINVVDKASNQAEDKYADGAQLIVNGKFDDHNGKIHENDFIKITWPSDTSARAYISGYPGEKSLYIKGVYVGDYQVKTNEAILTFNKNIDDFSENVYGGFLFEVKTRNLDTADHDLNFSSGNVVKVITEKGQSSTPQEGPGHKAWQGSKVGDLRFDEKTGKYYIMWGVYLNSDAAYLDDDIVMTDPIGDGMKLDTSDTSDTSDPSSIYFYIDGEFYKLKEFEQAFPKASLTTDGNVLKLTLDRNHFSGRSVMIGYKTTLTDTSLLNYDNTATITYRLSGEKQPTTVHRSKTVQNAIFDAYVHGTNPRELKIIKQYQDDDGSTKTAQGVVFEITYPDGKTVKETTDAKGIIDLTDLDAGTYMIKEISAPSYLEVSNQTWKYVVSAKENGQALTVFDKKKPSTPWMPLTPAKKTTPWMPLTPAKKTTPWMPLTPAKKTTPWMPLTPAKKTTPWTPLTPAKKTTPWMPLTPAKKTTPWTPLTPAKKTTPWMPLTPAKKTTPWTPLTPAKKTTPWTPLTPSTKVIPWTDYSNNKSQTVIPWTPLVPQDVPSLEPAKRAQDSATPTTDDVIPWTSLTPSTPAMSNENQPTTDDSTTPNATTTSETDLAVPEDVPTSSTSQQPVVENTSQPVLATTDRVLPASTIKTDTQENAVRGNELPQTGNNKNAQLAIFVLGGLLLVASLAVAPKRN